MLTDTKVKQAKSQEKPYKFYDAEGLYIEIAPTGSKKWRWRYRWQGKEKLISFGLYPEVSLKAARDSRDSAKKLLASGKDPSQARKEASIVRTAEGSSFGMVAERWYAMHTRVWSEHHTKTVRSRLDNYILPKIGRRALSSITPQELMVLIRDLEARGILETASRVLGIYSQIFRLAVAEGKTPSDPCRDLRGALAPSPERHFAALTTKAGAQAVMRAIDGYLGSCTVRAAVRFTALTFVRQQEIRFATWQEINWEEGIWLIPAERMKMKRDHIVPLSRQAIEVLTELRSLTGEKACIFMGEGRGGKRPISENTVRCALRSMGFSNEEMTAHGFRSMASTLLNEMGFRSDVIERQLAHVEGNSVRAAYNRAEYLTERREMMQHWADFLDSLR